MLGDIYREFAEGFKTPYVSQASQLLNEFAYSQYPLSVTR
jgi:hypothetical protein